MSRPDETPERPHDSVGERLIAAGGRAGIGGIRRVAGATGADRALEQAVEEAVIRAIESPATDRAIARALESPAMERRIDEVLDSELVDRVWERLLASDEAQKLVERIAQAPEVRSALAYQGAGLLQDVGHEISRVTRRLDDLIEAVWRRLTRRPERAERTDRAGLVSRGLALLLDAGILNAAFFAASALLAYLASSVAPDSGLGKTALLALGGTAWAAAGGAYLFVFWTLAGQTLGMRFLGLEIVTGTGAERLEPRQAVRRLLGLALSIIPLGLGLLAILGDERRRGWHDRIALTEVRFAPPSSRAAPWADPPPAPAPAPAPAQEP